MDASGFAGKTVLVTGSTSGIGAATALSFAGQGAHVIVSGRDRSRGTGVVDVIRSRGGMAHFVSADLGKALSVRRLAEQAAELGGGRVDVLVNNAGVYPFLATDRTTEEDLDQVYAINVKAPYLLVGELAPAMAARGGGAIVNVTTMVAAFGLPGMALYGSSKAALTLLTKAWAAEFGPLGVRVNAVMPGPTRTEGTARMSEGPGDITTGTPAGRAADPQEIASVITFLAGDEAGFVHGSVWAVDGGRTAV
jgi:NAD(P)-dependent dehydrogenase (short-subunit alcohol dehydrogenase family)